MIFPQRTKLFPAGAIVCALLWTLVSAPAAARESRWAVYENAHFIAYSDANEKRVRDLLRELEQFRTATLQVGNIRVPESAPKQTVLILRKKGHFQDLAPNNASGFFIRVNEDEGLMVLAASGSKSWAKTVIRHEYAHALLRYKDFDYPQWYEEGFAEMAAATEVINNGRSFTVGAVTDRARYNGAPSYPWDELIADGFDLHTMRDPRKMSSAYAQAWLLAHYATLGDNLQNSRKLQRYFNFLKTGESSASAFEEAFGIELQTLWKQHLKSYSRRVPVYTIDLDASAMDPAFERTAADTTTVQPMLAYLETRATALWQAGKPPEQGLARVAGTWDTAAIDAHCDDPVRFDVATDGTALTVERWPGEKKDDGPIQFTIEEPMRSDFMLFPVANELRGNEDQARYVSMQLKSENVACWRWSTWQGAECGIVLTRCSD